MASSTLCNLLLVFSPCKEVGHDCAGFETLLYPLELSLTTLPLSLFSSNLFMRYVLKNLKIKN